MSLETLPLFAAEPFALPETKGTARRATAKPRPRPSTAALMVLQVMQQASTAATPKGSEATAPPAAVQGSAVTRAPRKVSAWSSEHLDRTRRETKAEIGGLQIGIDGYPQDNWDPRSNPWSAKGKRKDSDAFWEGLRACYEDVIDDAELDVGPVGAHTESLFADLLSGNANSYYSLLAIPLLLRTAFPDSHFDMSVPVQKLLCGYPGRDIDKLVILPALHRREIPGLKESAFLAVAKKVPYFQLCSTLTAQNERNFFALVRLVAEGNWDDATTARRNLVRLTHLHFAKNERESALQTVPPGIKGQDFWSLVDELAGGNASKHMLQALVAATADFHVKDLPRLRSMDQGLFTADSSNGLAGDAVICQDGAVHIVIDAHAGRISADKVEVTGRKALQAGCSVCFIVNTDGKHAKDVSPESTMGDMRIHVVSARDFVTRLAQIGVKKDAEHDLLQSFMSKVARTNSAKVRNCWNTCMSAYKRRPGLRRA